MSEPTPEPTLYDEIQDTYISALQEIVTPSYSPPQNVEYSFPVVGQGINSQQFQLISRAAGTGVYVQHDAEGAQSPYRLTQMPGGASETNATNQMMLRTSNVTGRSEAVIEGFFHTQLQDMTIDLPAVSTPTTYHICLTLDLRNETNPEGPVSVKTYAGPPPVDQNRKHIVLWTVARQPNQLLTNAIITETRPWLGHVINVWSYDDLPEAGTVEYGTLAIVINPSRAHVPEIYTNRGIHGWVNTSHGGWENITEIRNTWGAYGSFPQRARRTNTGAQIDCTLTSNGPGTLSEIGMELFRLPSYVRPPAGTRTANALLFGVAQNYSAPIVFRLQDDGWVTNLKTYTSNLGWVRVYGEVFYN